MNGTPWANAFGRLQTGPSERSPASYQSSSASSPGSIASAPSRWSTATGGPAVVVPQRDRDRRRAAASRTAPARSSASSRPAAAVASAAATGCSTGGAGSNSSTPSSRGDPIAPARHPSERGEHREDRPAHAAGAHPRKVEVAAGPARRRSARGPRWSGRRCARRTPPPRQLLGHPQGQVDRRQAVDAVGVRARAGSRAAPRDRRRGPSSPPTAPCAAGCPSCFISGTP